MSQILPGILASARANALGNEPAIPILEAMIAADLEARFGIGPLIERLFQVAAMAAVNAGFAVLTEVGEAFDQQLNMMADAANVLEVGGRVECSFDPEGMRRDDGLYCIRTYGPQSGGRA